MVFFPVELSSNPVSDGLNFGGRAHLRYPRKSVFLQPKAFLIVWRFRHRPKTGFWDCCLRYHLTRWEYLSGAANWNYHHNTMISDFESACLRQKIDFRDGQKQFGCAVSGWLLVCWSLVSHFYFRIGFSEKEFNWKASCKTIRIWWFCNPSKTYQSLVEKLFGPMSFEEKIMGRKKIKNVLIISEAKLRLMSQFSIKVYVGYTPPQIIV